MQHTGQHPHRPVALQGSSELQQLLELMRSGGSQQHSRSAFSSLPTGQPFLPELSLYHAAQLSGLFGSSGQNEQLSQLAQLQQLQNLQTQANAAGLLGTSQTAPPESSTSRNSQLRTASKADKSTTAYASRHQAAEQRRRTRINDRLDALRSVVPHSERANTATFLEEVIKYVTELQARVTVLEKAQGLPLTSPPKTGTTQPAIQQSLPACPNVFQYGQNGASSGGLGMPNGMQNFVTESPTVAPDSLVQTSEAAQSTFQKDRPETPPQSLGESVGNDGGGESAPCRLDEPPEGMEPKRQKLSPSRN